MTDAKDSTANSRRLTGESPDFFDLDRWQNGQLGRWLINQRRQRRERDREA
jgi:hypothetical protein